MVGLPDELITYILLRVPANSLARFRFVSKHWCALIDDNYFIKKHLSLSITNKSKQTIVFQDDTNIYSLALNNSNTQAQQLALPINTNQHLHNDDDDDDDDFYNIKLLGSCNGLLCLLYPRLDDLIVIWNPATRKHVKLPVVKTIKSGLDEHDLLTVVHGFGYDSVSDDYKVVMLVQFCPSNEVVITGVYVYGFRSNLWRVSNDFPYYLVDGQHRPDTLVCGALHWIVTEQYYNATFKFLIVALDLAKEEPTIIPGPDYHGNDNDMILSLSELDGCLFVVHIENWDGFADVWVMKDYGVKESWTKLLTITDSKISRFTMQLIPLTYSEIGDEVLFMQDSRKLIWFNLENSLFKFVDVPDLPKIFQSVIFLESLVSIGDKIQSNQKQSGNIRGEKEDQEQEGEWYVVFVGRIPGIYNSWPNAHAQITDFQHNSLSLYNTKTEAQKAFTIHLGKRDHSSCSYDNDLLDENGT